MATLVPVAMLTIGVRKVPIPNPATEAVIPARKPIITVKKSNMEMPTKTDKLIS